MDRGMEGKKREKAVSRVYCGVQVNRHLISSHVLDWRGPRGPESLRKYGNIAGARVIKLESK
jgi:hypothetical protein